MPIDYSLYLIAQTNACAGLCLVDIIEQSIQGGVTMVQLREKDAETGAFIKTAQAVKQLLNKYQVPLLINDRVDVALAVDAAGVHLGQSDMSLAMARKLLGRHKMIGISASTIEQAQAAEAGGATYVGASAVFATPTKTNVAVPLGLSGLKAICSSVKIPVVAVGGIDAGNAHAMRQNGAAGIAVVRAIMQSPEPKLAAGELKRALAGKL